MITEIPFEQLLNLAKQRPTLHYFYKIWKRRYCFSGEYDNDMKAANMIIDSYKNDSTANSYRAALVWAFDQFYGNKFNHKHIKHRPHYSSHFTTRLEVEQIDLIRNKFNAWINYDHVNVLPNKRLTLKYSHKRIYHCFEALLKSGMRVGELVNIDFQNCLVNRFIKSEIHNEIMVEIIINTEKTKKKREVYIPFKSYLFLKNDTRKLSRHLIIDGFIAFRRWANLPIRLTAHVCRRTLATTMHESGVDIHTIAMVLGNTPGVVMNHYIISSCRNYDAVEIAYARMNNSMLKINNMFVNNQWMRIKKLN